MNKTKLSKTVSYILRHHPEDFNLKLAADASVKTDELLQALRRNKQPLILKVKAFQAYQRGEYIVWKNLKKELLVVLEN